MEDRVLCTGNEVMDTMAQLVEEEQDLIMCEERGFCGRGFR